MDNLQEIALKVSAFREEMRHSMSVIQSFSTQLRESEENARKIMHTSVRKSYGDMVGALSEARRSMSNAVAYIMTADKAAESWLQSHIVGSAGRGGSSRETSFEGRDAFVESTSNENVFLDSDCAFDSSNEAPQYSTQHDTISLLLQGEGVENRGIHLFGQLRSPEKIVEQLGGGDLTQGSCSSLAFAYAGNRAGYQVLDFRGGRSREFFSLNESIQKIAELPGVEAFIEYGTNDIECTHKLMERMVCGKEYYFATAEHAAVIRLSESGFEYLELQSKSQNGWHDLNDFALFTRFGCDCSEPYSLPNFLIDIDSLGRNADFLDILGFINTAEAEQQKGADGYER